MTKKCFAEEEKYKLYRNIKELFHPSISKKNISDYKIIIQEDMYPIQVFYPKKISNLDKVIIFIHGNSNITNSIDDYSTISDKISKYTDKMVILIDYEEKNVDFLYDNMYENVKNIYMELLNNGINENNITIIGDSTGGSIVLNIINKLRKENIEIKNIVLFYPVLSGEYFGTTKYKSIKDNNAVDYKLINDLKKYYRNISKNKDLTKYFALKNNNGNYSYITIISGKADPLLDEAIDFSNTFSNINLKIIDFANHGFLNSNDKEINKEVKKILSENNND